MIVCINAYKAKAGQAEALVDELRRSGIEEALGSMPGNVCFNFSVSIADPDTIYLTDVWEDEAAFKAHLFREETAVWAALKERYVEDSQLKEYDL